MKESLKRKYVKKGTVIIMEGDPSDYAYILESGSAEISKSLKNGGGKKVLGTIHEKDIFGELGLIDGHPRSTTVTALHDCVITVLLSKKDYDSLLKNNAESLSPLLRIITNRYRGLLRQLE